ncbi:ABC transporter substrate-binding protein [Streptomyces sp. YIM 98790]|uniref:ABC transporter substrate-binding protein n=1 Tax=Streptomyces sp. YIM 98790 TaxID=2689077 RepID=UPI0014087138|nr:ABC transporter substrate-binding protein [Streptomyces sp. YIM 98790]
MRTGLRNLPLDVLLRWLAAAVALVLLGVAGKLGYDWFEDARTRCAAGVVERGDDAECVGVTDGAHSFAPHLDRVTELIKKENDKVVREAAENGTDYVSIAYMTSFTLTESDTNSEASARRELQGAYLAQLRHNSGDLRKTPKIRLLIANIGSNAGHWEHTVQELVRRQDTDDRLVAVAGLGPSTDENLAALTRLSEEGLATVASTMTATNIKDIEGFARVPPTNEDEAQAAAAYLKREGFRTAVVVQDVAGENLYAATLARAFLDAYPDGDHTLVDPEPMPFDSSKDSWETELYHMPAQLCQQLPEVVYFAGRGKHLTYFLERIAGRTCVDHEFTVMTGDDTTNLTAEELEQAARTKVEVVYTGLAHPDMRQGAPPGVNLVDRQSAEHFGEEGLLAELFPKDPRDDGQAMVAHDSVLVAATAATMAAEAGRQITGQAVGRMFHQMDAPNQVPGASGWLSFQLDGNPVDKAVPILELTEDGVAVFRELSAAGGTPLEGEETGDGG